MWPQHEKDLKGIFRGIVKSPKQVSFICHSDKRKAVGFANFSIRTDYVEGASSSPVGYLEGIFVQEKFRKKGVARMLLQEGEKWALKKGCVEMGSDTGLSNRRSQKFHKALGFRESAKLVAFIKKIRRS